MKILSWNYKGLHRPAAVQTLRRLIRDQSPNILFLSNTKIFPPQVSAALNRLGFFLMTQVTASGTSGGLVLSWQPGVVLECFSSNKNNITAWCYSDPPNPLRFFLVFMDPQTKVIEQLFGILLLLLGKVLKPLGCALVTSTQCWIKLRKVVVDLWIAHPTTLLKSVLIILE